MTKETTSFYLPAEKTPVHYFVTFIALVVVLIVHNYLEKYGVQYYKQEYMC